MKRCNVKRPGFNLVEIVAIITIILTLAVIGMRNSSEILRQNRLANQVRWIKTQFTKARSKAIENTAPVRFTFDRTTMEVLLEMDMARDGSFQTANIETLTDTVSPYQNVLAGPATGVPALPHYAGAAFPADAFNFNPVVLIVLPSGRVIRDDNRQPANGSLFFRVDSASNAVGAVHVNSLGQVKTAFNGGDQSGPWDTWIWTE